MTRVAAFALACSTVLLGGCISVSVGNGDSVLQVQYRLSDLAPVPPPAGRTVPRALVVVAMPSVGIGDTFAMAYSPAPQQRALYQYASWADRPSSRIAQLLVRRMEARGLFASVSELGRGLGGDLSLHLTIDELVHDTVSARGRLQVRAELIDRTTRTMIARRRFEAAAPVNQENAQGAVDALSRALTTVLDELVPWIEATADKLPARVAR